MSGAVSPGEVEKMLADLGFREISITPKEQSSEIVRGWNISEGAEDVVFSAYIKAIKPE